MPAGWAAAIGAVGAIGGAFIAGNSAENAAETQAESTAAGIGEQRRQADRAYADQAAYRTAGKNALGTLQTEIDRPTTAADAMSDPGYEFGMRQGQMALDRKAAAAGGRISGASLKSASQYATDYASSGFNAAYQRKQDRLNRLASIAGLGQTATNSSAASGANSANAITGLLTSQGNASAAGQLAQGNIWGNAINQIGAEGQRYFSRPRNTDTGMTNYSSFRNDDPYKTPGYFGGDYGE